MNDAMEDRLARCDFVSRFAAVVEEQVLGDGSAIDQQLRDIVGTGALQYWLLRFLDVAVARWELCEQMSESQRIDIVMNESISCRTNPMTKMTDLLAGCQSVDWTYSFCKSILQYWDEHGHVPLAVSLASDDQIPIRIDRNVAPAIKGRVFISRTYLGRIPELIFSLMCGTLPSRWREPEFTTSINWQLRESISFQEGDFTPGTIEHFVCSMLPNHLPQSLLENLGELVEWVNQKYRKYPSAILTANLHVGSDSFLVWAAIQRIRGARLILSQHGGLNGQGLLPTRGEEFEQAFSDRYLHWGWSDQPQALVIPAQPTIWKKRRRSSKRKRNLVFITDCTFRFSRRPWASTRDDQEYRRMLVNAYEAIPQGIKSATIVRLHHDHNRYDESHEKMWSELHPHASLNNGLGSIEPLQQSARLVVCTTLGTSEIVQFSRSIPTVLRLHPEIHAVRTSCQALFKSMNDVGIVHYTDESFRSFLEEHWDAIDRWWGSVEVRSVVDAYLSRFGHQTKRPLWDLRQILFSATN